MKMKVTPFQEKVYAACRKIPRGKISTYQEIAKNIKNSKSMRAVGNALNKNPFAPTVPCHRVVRNGGEVGGFASGSRNKIRLLKKEGIRIKSGKIADFSRRFVSL